MSESIRVRFIRFRRSKSPLNELLPKAYEIENFLTGFGAVDNWGARYRFVDDGFVLDGYAVFCHPLSPTERQSMTTETGHLFGECSKASSKTVCKIWFKNSAFDTMVDTFDDAIFSKYRPALGQGACSFNETDSRQNVMVTDASGRRIIPAAALATLVRTALIAFARAAASVPAAHAFAPPSPAAASSTGGASTAATHGPLTDVTTSPPRRFFKTRRADREADMLRECANEPKKSRMANKTSQKDDHVESGASSSVHTTEQQSIPSAATQQDGPATCAGAVDGPGPSRPSRPSRPKHRTVARQGTATAAVGVGVSLSVSLPAEVAEMSNSPGPVRTPRAQGRSAAVAAGATGVVRERRATPRSASSQPGCYSASGATRDGDMVSRPARHAPVPSCDLPPLLVPQRSSNDINADTGAVAEPIAGRPTVQETATVELHDIPAAPVVRQATPQDRPVTIVDRPPAPDASPAAAEDQPVAPKHQPDTPDAGPVAAADQPIDPAARPVAPDVQPVALVDRPAVYAARPVAHENQPVAPSVQLIAPGARPALAERHQVAGPKKSNDSPTVARSFLVPMLYDVIVDESIDASMSNAGAEWIADALAEKDWFPLEIRAGAAAAARWLRANPSLHQEERFYKALKLEPPPSEMQGSLTLTQLERLCADIDRREKSSAGRCPSMETVAAIINVCCSQMRFLRDDSLIREQIWPSEAF